MSETFTRFDITLSLSLSLSVNVCLLHSTFLSYLSLVNFNGIKVAYSLGMLFVTALHLHMTNKLANGRRSDPALFRM